MDFIFKCHTFLRHKVEAPITDRGPIANFIFKDHTFLRHVSMKAIDNCLKLKLSGIGSSTLVTPWITVL
jgi:hypothetical protein